MDIFGEEDGEGRIKKTQNNREYFQNVLKEDYLQQNAFHEIDAFCSPEKQYLMLNNIFILYDKMKELLDEGVELDDITGLDLFEKVGRMKYEENIDNLKKLGEEIGSTSPAQFNVVKV